MSAQRSLSWSAALRDMRADRGSAAERRAYIAQVHAAKIETLRARCGTTHKLWTSAGGFDRRAIMVFAVREARCVRGCWGTAMADGLKSAWAAAHAARRAASN